MMLEYCAAAVDGLRRTNNDDDDGGAWLDDSNIDWCGRKPCTSASWQQDDEMTGTWANDPTDTHQTTSLSSSRPTELTLMSSLASRVIRITPPTTTALSLSPPMADPGF